MNRLFFDIETIPCDEIGKAHYLTMLREQAERKGKETEGWDEDKLHRDTALDGTHGRICCIGIIKEDHIGITKKEVLSGDEADILRTFWEISQDVDLFIGHNVFNFDFPFIYQRSIINGVKPRNLNFAKYRNDPIYDTMQEWSKWAYGNSFKSLDTLAKVLGFPTSKDEMDGSMVWDYFQSGKIEEISNYCMKDVELTRQIYYKMMFLPLVADNISDKEDLPF